MGKAKARGLGLLSGGLDSQLAVKVLERAGACMECIVFETPFFSAASAKKAASALGVKLHVVDFTDDEIALLKNPPHGFGSAMNPCIDCHATMIRRAGEMMSRLGFDFVSTGEVLGQRPMSQNRQALGIVEKTAALAGRLVRPLSARLLEPTLPETEGLLDRDMLLDISGRRRDRQLALAAEFGLSEFPSPAGGCKLTEAGFARRLADLMNHEGLDNRRLVDLIVTARRFRLPAGSSLILGRDEKENAVLRENSDLGIFMECASASGPSAIVPHLVSESDLSAAAGIVVSYSKAASSAEPVEVSCLRDGARASVFAAAMPRDKSKELQIF